MNVTVSPKSDISGLQPVRANSASAGTAMIGVFGRGITTADDVFEHVRVHVYEFV